METLILPAARDDTTALSLMDAASIELARCFPIAVILADLEYRCLYCNPRWVDLAKRSSHDSFCEGWQQAMLPIDHSWVMEEFDLARQQGREFSGDFRLLLPDGIHRMVHGRAAEARSKQGVLLGFILTFEDTSDRARMESELREALERSEEAGIEKSQLLANMSHEIRTPMNGILGMTAVLLSEEQIDATHRDYLETIQNSGESLLAVLNDILDFSKVEAGKLELERLPFDLHRAMRDVVALFSAQVARAGLELTRTIVPGTPEWVVGDAARLRQIVTNLVSNAIKFTTEGRVEVKVALETAEEDSLLLRIEVHDTGIGIPQDKLESVFGLFTQADASTTRRYGGTGLGLAISARLAELMGGGIRVSSEVGVGSVFVTTLRVARSRSTGKPVGRKTAAGAKGAHPGVNVLLVEDNAVNCLVATKLLEKMGCIVESATDGRKAVEMVQNADFDLVFMDCQMPEMDGFEATREIRRLLPEEPRLPIVALTANAMEGDRQRCLDAGMDDHLAEPLRVEALSDALSRWCAGERKQEVSR